MCGVWWSKALGASGHVLRRKNFVIPTIVKLFSKQPRPSVPANHALMKKLHRKLIVTVFSRVIIPRPKRQTVVSQPPAFKQSPISTNLTSCTSFSQNCMYVPVNTCTSTFSIACDLNLCTTWRLEWWNWRWWHRAGKQPGRLVQICRRIQLVLSV